MTLFGHVKDDLTWLTLADCLLTDDSGFEKATSPHGKVLEGCHLHCATNNLLWIQFVLVLTLAQNTPNI